MNIQPAVIAAPPDVLTEKPRISSIDVMRGIVMVIMALDHARDYFHLGAFAYDPTNLQTTTPAIFFTRWITHYCAPTFVFLAGTSIYISSQRKSKKELSMFLLTRGLWLIVLEVVVIRFALFFNFYYDIIVLQVIWVIGASMVVMAGAIHLSHRTVVAIGAAIVLFHNVADQFLLTPQDGFYPVWAILRQSGFFQLGDSSAVFVPYPVLSWLGIMMLGFGIGKLYEKSFDSTRRQALLIQIGMGAIALFLVLRFFNLYGDGPWIEQLTKLYSVMSFLNVTKYPVSLQYTLMTIGPMLIFLSLLEKRPSTFLKPFQVFGRVPMFYYILHFFLIHAIAVVLFMNKMNVSLSEMDFHFNKSFGGITPFGGYSLGWVYVGWIAVVLALYPLCKWYNEYKSKHSHWWLSYL